MFDTCIYKKYHQLKLCRISILCFFLCNHNLSNHFLSAQPEGYSRSWRWETHPVRADDLIDDLRGWPKGPKKLNFTTLKTTREATMVVWKMISKGTETFQYDLVTMRDLLDRNQTHGSFIKIGKRSGFSKFWENRGRFLWFSMVHWAHPWEDGFKILWSLDAYEVLPFHHLQVCVWMESLTYQRHFNFTTIPSKH